ncbi:unnamed protein product [Mycena citricolor]|uniref:Uncharacterized protein n=1 Tax=Mycena citricolor TaxID=2018698 RepID=A0AAD2HEQ7_9AGAR|nr:unnamed protein product [Mycena citricolor]
MTNEQDDDPQTKTPVDNNLWTISFLCGICLDSCFGRSELASRTADEFVQAVCLYTCTWSVSMSTSLCPSI